MGPGHPRYQMLECLRAGLQVDLKNVFTLDNDGSGLHDRGDDRYRVVFLTGPPNFQYQN